MCRAEPPDGYVGLKASYADKPVGSISGGECQRVAIARALLCDPKMIIFDEATSALDVSIQAQIIRLMKKLKEKRKVAFLFITHDLAVASAICDRLAVMYECGKKIPGCRIYGERQVLCSQAGENI